MTVTHPWHGDLMQVLRVSTTSSSGYLCACVCLVAWTSRISTWPTLTPTTDAFKPCAQTNSPSDVFLLLRYCQQKQIASSLKPNLYNGNTSGVVNLLDGDGLCCLVFRLGGVKERNAERCRRASKNTNCSTTLHASSSSTTTTPPTTRWWPTERA